MYCIECGAALRADPPTRCSSCGVQLWRNAKLCAALLLVDAGKLLLVRRAVEPWLGRWDVPGGFCEYGEHPISTAIREAREETGLAARVTGYLGMWQTDEYLNTRPPSITVCAFYHGELAGTAAVSRDGEVSEIGWFDPAELPDQIAFPEQQGPALAAWRAAVADIATHTRVHDLPYPSELG
jgi:8-oxo-dGTP diphosphatase